MSELAIVREELARAPTPRCYLSPAASAALGDAVRVFMRERGLHFVSASDALGTEPSGLRRWLAGKRVSAATAGRVLTNLTAEAGGEELDHLRHCAVTDRDPAHADALARLDIRAAVDGTTVDQLIGPDAHARLRAGRATAADLLTAVSVLDD